MSRTSNTIRNMKFALVGQIMGILIGFVSRKVFVMFLSTEYLGLNGLFSNILSMLALAELGVGTAIVYSLYKPIAKGDFEEIKSLMRLYKNIYTAVGFLSLPPAALLPLFFIFLSKICQIFPISGLFILSMSPTPQFLISSLINDL